MTCRGPLTSPSPDTESGPAEANWWLLGGGIALLALGLTLLVAGRVERQRWVGIDLLLLGALALGAGLGDLPGRWRALDDAGRQRLATWLAGGLLVVLWAPYILLEQSVDAGGARYWFLGDDAMISMRYARNLAEGDGLVWNPGERVEGFTNPAWTLVMAAVHLTRLPDRFTSLPMLLINLALGVATLPLVARLVRLLGGGAFAVAGALSAVALNQNVGYWATQGFETPLLTLLAMVGVCRILQERGGSPRLSTYLLIGAIGVVRSDGVVLAGLLWVGGVMLCGERRRALLYAVAGLLLPAGAELLRLWYYGEPLPNTAYLKTAKWDGREVAGSRYVARFALRYTVPLIAAVAGAVAARDRRAGLLLGGMALYAVAVEVP